MKTCPTCLRAYEDDTLVYCLDDGARLFDAETTREADATLNLPVAPTINSSAALPKGQPTSANPQPTITARPEQFRAGYSPRAGAAQVKPHRSSLPWVFAIVLVLGVSGVVIAWMMTRGGNDQARGRTGEPTPFTSPRSSPKATAEVSPSPKEAFTTIDNMTLDGTRITYYPRPSFDQCQADCLGNANCRGFTWIRPGAYNPGDAAMCYLMSALTERIPHTCCISGVRN